MDWKPPKSAVVQLIQRDLLEDERDAGHRCQGTTDGREHDDEVLGHPQDDHEPGTDDRADEAEDEAHEVVATVAEPCQDTQTDGVADGGADEQDREPVVEI